jgi:hypothetical protein
MTTARRIVLAGMLALGMGLLQARGVTLLVEYDLATSWTGTQVTNSGTLAAAAMTATHDTTWWAAPPAWAGSPIPADQFATPTYHAAGAGAGNRPFLEFDKYGMLGASTPNFGVFGANSYSVAAYYRVGSDLHAPMNSGVGTQANTSFQNLFVFVPGTSTPSLSSYTVLYDSGTATWQQVQSNINGIVTRDEWVHLVKVHDMDAKEVRFYVDGTLALTTPFDPGAGNYMHWPRDDFMGVIGWDYGSGARQIRGIDFSYFAAYEGVLTPQEILASYQSMIPEPAAGVVLLLLCAGSLARRGRRR